MQPELRKSAALAENKASFTRSLARLLHTKMRKSAALAGNKASFTRSLARPLHPKMRKSAALAENKASFTRSLARLLSTERCENDCACGEIGRRARLRIWCSDTCRFESYQAHDWTKEEFSKEFSSFLFSSSTDGDGLSRIGKSLRPRASGMIYCQHEFKREFKQKHAS